MAGSSAERASLEAEYAERLSAGPDFAAYRGGSVFAEPHRHQMTKADRAQILGAFDEVRRWHYANLREPHGQGVSRLYREILSILCGFALKFQTVYPSLATVARMACCSVRTVSNALAWLKMWGFLDWTRRLARKATRLGARVVQASNAYVVALKGLAAIGVAVFSGSNGNNCPPSKFQRQIRKLLPQEQGIGAA